MGFVRGKQAKRLVGSQANSPAGEKASRPKATHCKPTKHNQTPKEQNKFKIIRTQFVASLSKK